MKTRNGFTLVEILIVVVILGILAAMVIPVFGQATTDSKTSALASNLQKVRLEIELYRNYHNGNFPCAGSATATFEQALTGKTDMYGNPGGTYGTFLERIPVNSFNGKVTVRINGAPAGSNQDGWRYDSVTGKFQADDDPNHAAML